MPEVVIPFARMEDAFNRDPTRYHEAIEPGAAEAAEGDPTRREAV